MNKFLFFVFFMPFVASATGKPLSMIDVLQQLHQAGYQQVSQIVLKGNAYNVVVVDPSLQKAKFTIAAQGGSMPAKKTDKTFMTMLQIAQKLQALHYTNVQKISLEHGHYITKAALSHGRITRFVVDPYSGNVSDK